MVQWILKKIKNNAWQMRKMVYIKRHADSAGTSAGDLRLISEKNEKKVSNGIWQVEKVCYIKLLSRFQWWKFAEVWKKTFLKKFEKVAWQSWKVCYIKNSLPVKRWQLIDTIGSWELLMFLEKLNSANGPDLPWERSKTLEWIRFGRFF